MADTPQEKQLRKSFAEGFATALKECRTMRNLTGPELASMMHVNYSSYRNWEAGDRPPPIPKILRLERILNQPLWVHATELMGGDDAAD